MSNLASTNGLALKDQDPERSIVMLQRAKEFLSQAKVASDAPAVKKLRDQAAVWADWLKRQHANATDAHARAGVIVALADRWIRDGYQKTGPGKSGPRKGKRSKNRPDSSSPLNFTKADFAVAVDIAERALQRNAPLDGLTEAQVEAAATKLAEAREADSRPTTEAEFRAFVSDWYEYANSMSFLERTRLNQEAEAP